MFNFKKPAVPERTSQLVMAAASKEKINTNDLVAQIHAEFDEASEKAIQVAKDILANDVHKARKEKSDRLRALGFSSAKDVADFADMGAKVAESEKVSGYVRLYQQNYPNYKFIDEAAVQRICEKYKLLCGDVDKYIGDIPDKNLKEIEAFELRKEDQKKKLACWWVAVDWTRQSINMFSSRLIMYERYASYSHKESDKRFWGYYDAYGTGRVHKTAEGEKWVYIKEGLKICASGKDFDQNKMQIKDGYKLEPIPDPVVLQPVSGGYLILSKWGLEGNDPELVNEKLN